MTSRLEDLCALVDACIEQGMNLGECVRQLREEQWMPITTAKLLVQQRIVAKTAVLE